MSVSMMSVLALSAVAVSPSEVSAKNTSATTQAKSTVYKAVDKKKKVVTVAKGKKVTVISKTGSWTKIKYGKYTGYTLTKNLKFTTVAQQNVIIATEKGKILLKKLTSFNQLAKAGNITAMSNGKYDELSTLVANYESEVSNYKMSSEEKTKLNTTYTKPLQDGLERYSNELDAWRLLGQAESNIKNNKYDSAQKRVDAANEAYAAGKLLRENKKYAALPTKLATKLEDKFKVVQQRFSYSTFNQLFNDKKVSFSTEEYENTIITENNPFVNSEKKKYTDGFVTPKVSDYGSYIEIDNLKNAGFKSVSLTLSLGDYWNSHELSEPVTFYVQIDTEYYEMYSFKLSGGDEPLEINIPLENMENSLTLHFEELEQQIGLTNFKFNR